MTIDKLKKAIKLAVENNNNYAALALAMAIPDICGKLEYPNKSSKERFKIWFDKYLKQHYETEIIGEKHVFMTSSDCYALRCAILHEASEDITSQSAQEILHKIKFTTLRVHRIKTDNILSLNVKRFCHEICDGVDSWLDAISENQEILNRINLMLKIEDSGGFNPIPGVRIG